MAAAEERPRPVQTKREDGNDNNNSNINSRSAVKDDLVEVKSDHDVEEYLEGSDANFTAPGPRRGTMAAAEERPHPVQTKREDGTDNNNTSNSRSAVGDELVEVKSDHDVEEHLERLRREFYSTRPASVGDGWLPPANIAFDPDDDDNISCVSTQSDLLAMASDTAVGVGGQAQDATAR
eukprot:CAMPEP_0181114760 /NCGR_PEP_ID=MMETSP1071-20121207/21072_1 /TAXON_ID=35127 /ORGANISM="Thalassiosira sp., Strain NH16" /LENGTH=178 /DNA_ID=CAMNT_0023198925 /DNA_START=4 /DNA_END=538 /DNA_ORIENTATION=+